MLNEFEIHFQYPISAPLPQGLFSGPVLRLLWDKLKGGVHSRTQLLSFTYCPRDYFSSGARCYNSDVAPRIILVPSDFPVGRPIG
jgi:hypothetical protein